MNDGRFRDDLALERTRLANERTVLAYVRTALALAAAAAALLHFFPAHATLVGIAWLLAIAGAGTLAVGVYRFVAVQRRLERPRE